jgi:hypothetical protein
MKVILNLIKRFLVQDFINLENGLQFPKETQEQTLKRLLSHTKVSLEDFYKLPIRKYENIHNIRKLTKTPPDFYETTSGSSGLKKKIPYTKDLINDFTLMFRIWCYDILAFGPQLRGGKIYFSISPQFTGNSHINDDSDYLNGFTGLIFKKFTLVPSEIKKVSDPEEFKKITAMYLVSSKNLEVISIWSPSFLIVLLDSIIKNHQEIEEALTARSYQWKDIVFKFPKTNLYKIHELNKPNINYNTLFPKLKIISCWGALNSKQDFHWLKKTFPNVYVQEKGLLSTEAAMTIPSIKYGEFLPALNQTYFEFLDSKKKLLPIHKLRIGEIYEIVLSQSSGLLRYQIGDMVKVVSIVKNTPCFEFIGRGNNVSDLVGEKLNEIFLINLLESKSFPPCIFIPSMLTKRYYCISESEIDLEQINSLLMKNPHYENAIKLGQLSPLELVKTTYLNKKVKSFFVEERGMKLGDIKDQILFKNENDNKLLDYLL